MGFQCSLRKREKEELGIKERLHSQAKEGSIGSEQIWVGTFKEFLSTQRSLNLGVLILKFPHVCVEFLTSGVPGELLGLTRVKSPKNPFEFHGFPRGDTVGSYPNCRPNHIALGPAGICRDTTQPGNVFDNRISTPGISEEGYIPNIWGTQSPPGNTLGLQLREKFS